MVLYNVRLEIGINYLIDMIDRYQLTQIFYLALHDNLLVHLSNK